MKNTYLLLLITIPLTLIIYSQDSNYWKNAKSGKTKIFTIQFTDELNGQAISGEGDVMVTVDGGESWKFNPSQSLSTDKTKEKYLWKADIYCSVMKTTDSGFTWIPYDKSKQEHFCCVYLKDENTGYNVASNFLNKVTSKISTCFKKNEINSIIDYPQQCTEYYRSAEEGWALGWCVKDFKHSTDSK